MSKQLFQEFPDWQDAARKQIADETFTLTAENVKLLYGYDIDGDTHCMIHDGMIITPWGRLIKETS